MLILKKYAFVFQMQEEAQAEMVGFVIWCKSAFVQLNDKLPKITVWKVNRWFKNSISPSFKAVVLVQNCSWLNINIDDLRTNLSQESKEIKAFYNQKSEHGLAQ